MPDLQTDQNLEYDFEFDHFESNEIPIPPVSFILASHFRNLERSNKKNPSGRRFRKWWQNKKNSVFKIFASLFFLCKKESLY